MGEITGGSLLIVLSVPPFVWNRAIGALMWPKSKESSLAATDCSPARARTGPGPVAGGAGRRRGPWRRKGRPPAARARRGDGATGKPRCGSRERTIPRGRDHLDPFLTQRGSDPSTEREWLGGG